MKKFTVISALVVGALALLMILGEDMEPVTFFAMAGLSYLAVTAFFVKLRSVEKKYAWSTVIGFIGGFCTFSGMSAYAVTCTDAMSSYPEITHYIEEISYLLIIWAPYITAASIAILYETINKDHKITRILGLTLILSYILADLIQVLPGILTELTEDPESYSSLYDLTSTLYFAAPLICWSLFLFFFNIDNKEDKATPLEVKPEVRPRVIETDNTIINENN